MVHQTRVACIVGIVGSWSIADIEHFWDSPVFELTTATASLKNGLSIKTMNSHCNQGLTLGHSDIIAYIYYLKKKDLVLQFSSRAHLHGGLLGGAPQNEVKIYWVNR